MSFDPKETSVLDDATLVLASASEGEPLSLAPTKDPMMCASPPQTELELSYLLAVVKQLTQWLHVVNTLVDTEQKKLCGVLGALSTLRPPPRRWRTKTRTRPQSCSPPARS